MFYLAASIAGWIGAALFASCGLPQAWKVHRTKKCRDLSWIFLFMWFTGEIFTLTYVLSFSIINGVLQLPLICNYVFNIGIVTYLIRAKKRYDTN